MTTPDDTVTRSRTTAARWFALSAGQTALWHAQQLLPQTPICIAQVLELDGPLDIPALQRSAETAAHELGSPFLRFGRLDGQVVQRVDHADARWLHLVDLRGAADPTAAARSLVDSDLTTPIDLFSGAPGRSTLMQVGSEQYWWYARAHHVAIDGVGAWNVLRRAAELYDAAWSDRPPRPAGALTLPEILAWQNAYRAAPRAVRDRRYWAERLAGLRVVPSLTGRTAAPAPSPLTAAGALPTRLDRALSDAAAHRSGVPVLALTAVLLHLARMSGEPDVVVSLPVSGRTTAALRRSAGMVANTVPVRVRVDPDLRVDELVARVQSAVTGALRHQLYRLEDIRRDHAGSLAGRGAIGPLVDIMIVDDPLTFGAARTGTRVLSAGLVEDLVANVYRQGASAPAHLDLLANPRLHSPTDLLAHREHLLALLDDLAHAGPGTRAHQLAPHRPPTASAETRTAPDTSAHLLTSAAATHRDSIAISDDNRTLTYGELWSTSARLARELIGAGAGPEEVVVVAVDRSEPAGVTALWAIAQTGAAWMPIDPAAPVARIAWLLSDARPRIGITTARHRGALPDGPRWLVLDDPDTVAAIAVRPGHPVADADRARPLRPANLAYLIYTSGTTGTPKPVAVTHAGLAALAAHVVDRFRVTDRSRVLAGHAPGFDAALLEPLAAAAAGAELVLPPDGVVGGPALSRLLATERITHYLSTPAVLGTLAPERLPDLRTVVTGGEACPPAVVAAWAPGRRLINSYGPTEATVVATDTEPLDTTGPAGIGTPLPGTGALVLDRRLHLLPDDALGELYLAGPSLARGYAHDSPGTASTFVANPYACGARMYRTGDLVRRRRDGTLTYHGRVDGQLTLRGVRIEPAEIEAALTDHPDITGAAVTLAAGPAGDRLTAYLVARTPPTDGHVTDLAAAALSHARTLLPAPLVPTTAMLIERLPTTATGKLDRHRLPDPPRPSPTHTPARTDTERIVGDLAARLLGIERIGRSDNLFELGAHSLTAATLATELAAATGVTVGVRDIFEYPVVADLAGHLDHTPASPHDAPVLRARPRPSSVPLAPPQRALWLVSRLDRDSPVLNMPFAMRLRGCLDVGALTSALRDVITRHELLRTAFPVDAATGEPVQRLLDVGEVALDLTPVPTSPDEVPAAIAALTCTGFDIATGPCLRATLLRPRPGVHVLVLTVHHLVADGWSMRPLAADLTVAYAARTAGSTPAFAPLPVTYADYTLWQWECRTARGDLGTADAHHSLDRSADPAPLATDRPAGARRTARGEHVRVRLDGAACRRLQRLARDRDATAFMAYHALVTMWIHGLTGVEDIVLGTPCAGRADPRLAGLVGMFAGTLELRTPITATDTFADVLGAVRRRDLAAFAQPDTTQESMLENAGEDAPRPAQLTLIVQPATRFAPTLAGLTVEEIPIDLRVAKSDLALTVTEHHDAGGDLSRVDARIDYATELFDDNTADRYLAALARLVTSVADAPDRAIGTLP
ncbi:amino acid adenylation domain-containing protein [Rhodococcus sp. D2-41]|uniref:amino acid adenylation domain-containing protein n=1 Tax=Speluncibacter jeojiensis TaxID=2710754 RepID=UPI0024101CA5|nr:amino acid adenylation domain-containing protein [Rhodococcus sp. D2-41]MDG3010853.1 amino acid adenylation domain-containing protein [Rhodococcus sp. D2-41]